PPTNARPAQRCPARKGRRQMPGPEGPEQHLSEHENGRRRRRHAVGGVLGGRSPPSAGVLGGRSPPSAGVLGGRSPPSFTASCASVSAGEPHRWAGGSGRAGGPGGRRAPASRP